MCAGTALQKTSARTFRLPRKGHWLPKAAAHMPALTTLTQSIRLAHPLSAIHHSNLAQNFDTLKIRVHRFIPSALLGTVCAITLGFYAWTARPGVPQSAMGLWISS